MIFKVMNWNIAGAKYLETPSDKREEFRDRLNKSLETHLNGWKPNVVTLQEVVRYGKSAAEAQDLLGNIKGYSTHVFTLIDSDRLSSRAKWDKVRKLGGWPKETFFAQGNAFMFRDCLPHFPVWDLPTFGKPNNGAPPNALGHFTEQVNIESGLYFGDRNTEPRAALVAHFVYNPSGKEPEKPLDIFVVNIHLTTLMMEREGIPEIDARASIIRQAQLDLVFNGIVSRYNSWRTQGYLQRGEKVQPIAGETHNRFPPVWVLAGDFNFTPSSSEYEMIEKMNFIDVFDDKNAPTKAKGAGKPPTLRVDYIFAGPKFVSFDPLITQAAITNSRNHVAVDTRVSDHCPMIAAIPLAINVLEEEEVQ